MLLLSATGSRRIVGPSTGRRSMMTGMDRLARYSWFTLACNIAVILYRAVRKLRAELNEEVK